MCKPNRRDKFSEFKDDEEIARSSELISIEAPPV